jgi:hypothetical protein
MTSVNRDIDNWWVLPEMPEVVDSFTGIELHPLSDDVVVMPFPKYGLWWLMAFDGQFAYQATHGPYKDEVTAIEAGMRLVV